jgi:hypothetical protein
MGARPSIGPQVDREFIPFVLNFAGKLLDCILLEWNLILLATLLLGPGAWLINFSC